MTSTEDSTSHLYASPWNTNENTLSSCDMSSFTTISPKYDIMSTIPEECSPIFNRTVEKVEPRMDSLVVENSEDMVGSIFDYIGNNDDNNRTRTEQGQNKENNTEKCKSYKNNESHERDTKNTKSSSLVNGYVSLNLPKSSPAQCATKSNDFVCKNTVNVQYRAKWTSFTV